jgi:60 kDa SS-A/Ro ribonucleoprotein
VAKLADAERESARDGILRRSDLLFVDRLSPFRNEARMTRPSLFAGRTLSADARNEAGGLAHGLPPKHALAQLAATGCLANVYYADAETQLATLLDLVARVDDNLFLARLAIYSRQRAMMKDMPAALLLALAGRDRSLFRRAFPRVVDNGRVLRTFFGLLRSSSFGRKSLSHCLQRAVQKWLNEASVGVLLAASIGKAPSLRDVLRLARPTPVDNARRALFGFLTERAAEQWAPAGPADLPGEVAGLLAYRGAETEEQQVEILQRNRFRWDLLADGARGPAVWKALARQMGAQALRMNLNTLLRHGVFDDPEMVDYVAGRLADADEVRRARQFPYQYLAAYLNAEDTLPARVRSALQTAAENACGNVPQLPGPIVIGLDVSGSMSCAVTGTRGRGTPSKVRCIDVAALFAAAIRRRNPDSVIIPFDHQAHVVEVGAQEGILALAERLARYGGGGTDCAIPLAEASTTYRERPFAGIVLISDCESWIGEGRHGTTAVVEQWRRFTANQARLQPGTFPRLVCIDVQPYTTVQAPDAPDILNVGGFSDAVFEVVAGFVGGTGSSFVKEVEAIEV